MTARTETPPRGDSRMLLFVVAIGIQLALVGAYLAARVLSGGGDHGAAVASSANPGPAGTCGIACDVRTSFGSLVVGSAQAMPGLTAKDLAGNVHGIAGYVAPDQVQVQVTLEMTNRLRTPIEYSPDQFSLVQSGGKPIPVRAANIKPSKLYPDAAIDATLIFVAPRKGQKLQLAFKDRERAEPFLVDISHVDTSPKKGAGADDSHGKHP